MICKYYNCYDLKDVYCYAERVPLVSRDVFYYFALSPATLHVPAASLKKYKKTMPWKKFGRIVAIE